MSRESDKFDALAATCINGNLTTEFYPALDRMRKRELVRFIDYVNRPGYGGSVVYAQVLRWARLNPNR